MILIAFVCYLIVLAVHGTIVKLKYGEVEGRIKHSYHNKSFIAFEGIPYAKPPLGPLRFNEAEFPDKWEGVLQANKLHTCIQYLPLPIMGNGLMGNEDCLYINIYVPDEEVNQNANYDIVVFIHGGSFILGSPNMMGGPLYIMNKNVIYVSFNYRLGILGFLSTEDDVVPGNNGLKDQNLALRWIQENINAFGGNPDSVTLVGLSAGSASVHYHYLSPKSKGLFHRGICISGTALNTWSLVKNPRESAVKLGKVLHCDNDAIEEMVECLRGKSAYAIGHAILNFFVYLNIFPIVPFGPVIENSSDPFISEHPYKTLMEGNLPNDVPLILSAVQDEGIYPVGAFDMMHKMHELNEKWDHIIPQALNFHNILNASQQIQSSQLMRNFYFENDEVNHNNIMVLVKMFSDRLFYVDIQKTALLQASVSSSPVYCYFFSYELQQFNIFRLKGVAHADDAKLMFNLITAPKTLTKSDEIMMDFFTTLIGDYSADGVPKLNGINWTPVLNDTEGSFNYLHIYSGDNIKMEKIDEFAPMEFWESLNFPENEKLFQDELYI